MDLNLAKKEILEGEYVFAAYKNEQLIFKSKDQGVKPALDFLSLGPKLTSGTSVADRVIGKGSAMIISLSQCNNIYGNVVSKSAKSYLDHKQGVSTEKLVDTIINREGNGPCPVEKLLVDIDDPLKGLEVIKKFIESMRR